MAYRQAIIWNNTVLLLIEPRGTKLSEIWFKIEHFSYKKNELENVLCKILNSNVEISHSFRISVAAVQSFWHFLERSSNTAVLCAKIQKWLDDCEISYGQTSDHEMWV